VPGADDVALAADAALRDSSGGRSLRDLLQPPG
jgi:hypothetical protein